LSQTPERQPGERWEWLLDRRAHWISSRKEHSGARHPWVSEPEQKVYITWSRFSRPDVVRQPSGRALIRKRADSGEIGAEGHVAVEKMTTAELCRHGPSVGGPTGAASQYTLQERGIEQHRNDSPASDQVSQPRFAALHQKGL